MSWVCRRATSPLGPLHFISILPSAPEASAVAAGAAGAGAGTWVRRNSTAEEPPSVISGRLCM
jgi:hypothetical protein